MARLIERSSNEFVDKGATISENEMARLEGETSNALFDELARWNDHLKHTNIDFEELSYD